MGIKRKQAFGQSLYILHDDTNDPLLEDTPEALSKRIITTAESLKMEHNEVTISNIVACGADIKEKTKTTRNTLIKN